MRVFKLCWIVLLATGASFAGKVITYTASSNVSQEDANNTAIAGVAKQISSQVRATQTLTKEETTSGKKSSLTENFYATSQVTSNLKIKGITITPVKMDKGFKATATLDLDEFTADIQFQMSAARTQIAELEAKLSKSIDERQYAQGIDALQNANRKIDEYQQLVSRLASVYPVNEAHQLKHHIPELEAKLLEKLSQIRIEGPSETFTLSKSEMPPWNVTVFDNVGPVSNFPLVAKQGFQVLLERRTQTDGTATFNLRKVNFEKGPYEIIVEPNFTPELLEATGLRQKLAFSYQVSDTRYSIRILCHETAPLCNAIEKALAKKSIYVDNETTAPQLELKVNATEEKALKISDNMTRYTYNVDVALKGKGISFIASARETGKSANDATVKAIGKLDFGPLQKQLSPSHP